MYAETQLASISQYTPQALLTETEAKLVARSDARFVKVPVIDVKTLRIIVIAAHNGSTVVRCLLRDGVGKLAARRGGTVQDIDQAVARLLTR